MDMNTATLPKKGLKTRPYSMDMNKDIATLPKKGLKTRPYSMDMNKDIATLPKKGLKTRPYSMDMERMNKSDLEKLSKSELIRLLLRKERKPKVVIVDDTKPKRPNRPPPPIPEGVKPFKPKQTVKLRRKNKVVDDRPGWVRNPNTNRWIKIDGPTYRKLYPMQHVLNKIDKTYQEINETSKSIDDKYKKVSTQNIPSVPFNFDDDIFQTENTSLGKFKIISVQSRENKKFKSYTNEFKVKILKKLDDVKEIYHIFQELVKTVKRRRKLSNNDMFRLVIQTKSFLTLFQQNSIRLKISN